MLIELPFFLPGKIYRSPMPFSQYDHFGAWSAYQDHDVQLVVLLTEQQEYLAYARRDLPDFYRSQGLDVLHLPVPDFGIPTNHAQWDEGVRAVMEAAGDGKNVAVHCLAGLGRTGTFMACLAKSVLKMSGIEAIDWVREFIPGAMENSNQEEFVSSFPDTNAE
jgi:protein-tyrosine phosphatase